YWLRGDHARDLKHAPNGFTLTPPPHEQNWWMRFGPAKVIPPQEPLRLPSDDWPFLYLRQPMIPGVSLRGMAIMGGLALLLLWLFVRPVRGEARFRGLDWRLFFLGAGVLVIETQ